MKSIFHQNAICILLFSIILFSFYSCKKEDSVKNTITDTTKLKVMVNAWLDSKQVAGEIPRNERIELIRKNLDIAHAYTEKAGEGEIFFAIPIKQDFASNINKDQKPYHYLLLNVTKDSKVKEGNLVQYMPVNKEAGNKIPVNTFYKMLNNEKISIDGKFAFLSIFDRYLYEKKYENGKAISFTEMSSKKKQESNAAKVIRPTCIDWYLVTTFYHPDGHTTVSEQYLSTTCYCGCIPNEICEIKVPDCELGGDGGDLYDLEAESALFSRVLSANSAPKEVNITYTSTTMAEKTFQWVVVKNEFDLWRVTSYDIAEGYNSSNTGAILYRIKHQSSSISGQTEWGRIQRNGSQGVPFIKLSWSEGSSTTAIAPDYKSGTVSVSGTIKNFFITVDNASNSCTIRVH